jgi:hypothetical protein
VDIPLTLILLIAAFLAGTYRILARRAMPRTDQAVCAACGSDVRAFAWHGVAEGVLPRCSCGANLAHVRRNWWKALAAPIGFRAGPVRTVGFEPVRHLALIARAAVVLVVALLFIDIALLVAGRSWWTFAPTSLLQRVSDSRMTAAAEGALIELHRRVEAGSMPPRTAWNILDAMSGPAWFTPVGWRTEEALYRVAFLDREALREALAQPSALALSDPTWLSGPTPTGTLSVDLQASILGRTLPGCPILVRVEAVELDGEPCDWSLVPREKMPALAGLVGRRVTTTPCVLRIVPPTPLKPSGGTLMVRATLAMRNGLGFTMFAGAGDPIIESGAAPSLWGLDVSTAEVTQTRLIMLPIGPDSPSGASAGSSGSDG